jgi:flagellar biosynthesis GTPase FlhF
METGIGSFLDPNNEEITMPLSPEDIASIVDALKPSITEIASAAAAAHVTKRNESFEKKLDARLSTIASPAHSTEQEEPEEKVTLTTRMNKQERTIQELKDQLRAEKEANHRTNMRKSVESTLLKQGVKPELLKAAVAQIIHEDQLVSLDEQGNIAVKFVDAYGDPVSIEDGLSGWVKTEGKAFVAQPMAKGANQKPVRSHQTAPKEGYATQEEADEVLVDLIRQHI